MKGDTFLALVAGAVAGLTLGVLFAPEKGEETRRKVKAAAANGLDELGDLREAVENEAGDLKKEAREKIVESLDRLEKALRKKPEDAEAADETAEEAAPEEPEDQITEA